MKHITKSSPPPELKQWLDRQPVVNRRRINCSYDDMPTEVRSAVRQALLQEQGYLCCYTGMRIDQAGSHIEHLKPQAICQGHEDIAYRNLLAAFPGPRETCGFGAWAKRDWYDPALMVSPLHGGCEERFRFDQFGNIRAAANDQAAVETIHRLRLDHDVLTDWRRQAVTTALFQKSRDLSDAKLEKVAQQYCTRDLRTSQFSPFCFVIQQVAQDALRRRGGERKRRMYSRKQRTE